MGTTNYYVTMPSDKVVHCHGCNTDIIHLGKSSNGWTFLFRAHLNPAPDSGIPIVKDFETWKQLATMGPIHDEYNRRWTLEEMLRLITDNSAGRSHAEEYCDDDTFLIDGHTFINVEFY